MSSSARSVTLTVAATLNGFVSEMNRGQQSARQFSRTVASSADTAAQRLAKVKSAAHEVAVPLLAIGTVAAAGVAFAVKSFADFDEKMSSVKALSHATASEMEQLRDAALTTGSAIGYSATQAADAEIELVKAGVSASDIYGGALSGSLKLAAAGQIDVADATSIAASTLTQFGLKGRDVGHIADLLAAGADKALGGVSDLGEGLKYIGPVAASAHVSLEQTVGSLALLAQNGILGEQAGTSLRGVLLSLTAPSQQASDVMKQYGINVYDASGKFVGFNGVAEQLHDRLGKLDDSTRDLALGQIFGNAQITAATILMNGGASAVDKWTKAVNEQGFATEQAVGKMDNLNGDLTKLKASFQTAGIVTGEAANGPLRAAVKVMTDLINTYNASPAAVQGAVFGVGALTAAVALSGGTALIAIPKIVAFGEATKTLALANIPGVSNAAAIGLRSVSAFGAGFEGAAVRVAGLSKVSLAAVKVSEGLGKGLSAVSSFLIGPWGIALAAGAAAVIGLNAAVDSGAKSQDELQNSLATSANAVKALGLAGDRSGVSKFLAGDISKDLKDLPTVFHDLGDEGFSAGTVLRVVGDDFASLVDSKKKYIALGTLKEEAKSLESFGSALANLASADAPAAAKAFNQIVDAQKLSTSQASQLIDHMKDYKAELTNQATALGITASKQNLLLLATGDYSTAAEQAKSPTQANTNALQELQASGEDAAKAIEDTSNALKDLTSPTLDARAAQRDFQAAVDAVTSTIKDNADAYKDAGTSMDINTEEGRKNQAALDAIAQTAESAAGALYKQTGSQDQATAALQSGRDELIKALDQYGITGAAAEAYADQIIGTPTDWATQFTNNAADAGTSVDDLNTKIKQTPYKILTTAEAKVNDAQANVDALILKFQQVPASKRTEVQADIADASTKLQKLQDQLSAIQSKSISIEVAQQGGKTIAKADGGYIRGPGTGTSDSIPAWLSDGEFVIRARSVAKYGTTLLHAINQGRLTKQQIVAAVATRGYASGGPVTVAQYAPVAPVVHVTTGGSAGISLAGAQLLMSVDGRQMTAFVQDQILSHDQSQAQSSRLGRQKR